MKKLLAIALGIGIFTTATSQKVYVQGGVNLSNITTSNSGSTEDSHLLTTFNAGIMARSNNAEPIALEAGLLVEGKGAKSSGGSGSTHYDATFNPLYLQLPVNVVFRLPLQASNSNIFINAGPYVAMGIAGKSKVKGEILGANIDNSKDIQFTNADPNDDDQAYSKLKRFDYGVNVGAGIDLGKILLKANYGLGLSKINSMQTDNGENAKDKYRVVSISLGIPLSRR